MAKRYMERNKICKCQFCNQNFEAVRYNARFCSTRCRVAYKRFMDGVYILEHEIDERIDKLRAYYATDCQAAAGDIARKAANRLRYVAEHLIDE